MRNLVTVVPDGWLACEVLRVAVAVLSCVLGSRELHGAHYLSLGTEEGTVIGQQGGSIQSFSDPLFLHSCCHAVLGTLLPEP